MKINIKIWVGVIIVSALVLLFRNINFQPDKRFRIDRSFQDYSITEVKNALVESLDATTVFTDSLICAFRLTSLDAATNRSDVNLYDINAFHPLASFSFDLPKTAQIKWCSAEEVLYINRFDLFSYNRTTGKHRQLNPVGLACLNVCRTGPNTLLVFAELNKDGRFITGYFALDRTTGTVQLSKMLEENSQANAAPNSLIYSGKFTRIDAGTMCYYCDKYSKIFFFTGEGRLSRELSTADGAPRPTLVFDNETYFYKRGSTYNVNNAIRVEGKNLLVFSCRSEPVKDMVIDVYSLETGQYLRSTRFNYKNWNCPDIINVSAAGKNTIVNFQRGVVLFDFSSLGA